MIYYVLLLIMTVIGAVASLFFKRASGSDSFIKIIFNMNLYFGGVLYLISSVLNLYLLRYMDYSVVLPLTSITYIWTMLISYSYLKEKITIKKLSGVMLIIIGAMLVAR